MGDNNFLGPTRVEGKLTVSEFIEISSGRNKARFIAGVGIPNGVRRAPTGSAYFRHDAGEIWVNVSPFPGGFVWAKLDVGGQPPLADTCPPPIAALCSVGISLDAAREDHTHEGVHSIGSADGSVLVTPAFGLGDVDLAVKSSLKDVRFSYTAADLNRQGAANPDTNFTNYESNVNLRVWAMNDSDPAPIPLTLRSVAPANWDGVTPPSVVLGLLVNQEAGSVGDQARFRIRADYKSGGEIIPDAPGGAFAETILSADILISEPPVSGERRVLVVVFNLTSALISPADGVFLAIDRVAPLAGVEYNRSVFLSQVLMVWRAA